MSSKSKIIVFSKLPPPYHGQSLATTLFKHYLDEEFNVITINTSFGRSNPRDLSIAFLRYFFLHIFQLFKLFFQLNKTVRKGDVYGLYIVASPSLLGHIRNFITVLIARKQVNKIVAHIHNGNFYDLFKRSYIKLLTKRFARDVDTFVFLSKNLERRGDSEIPVSKRTIIPNPIDKDVLFSSEEVKTKIDTYQGNELIVTYLSNLIPSKGYMDLLKSIPLILKNKNGCNINFRFIGDYKNKAELNDLIRYIEENELDKFVKYYGRIEDRSVIKDLLYESHVFVLPTYYPYEAQPRSIIEAMNAGNVIVSTDHASIPDYVFDDLNGYLIPIKSPDAIATSIQKLFNEENWRRKAKTARKTYEDMFSSKVLKNKFVQLFQ